MDGTILHMKEISPYVPHEGENPQYRLSRLDGTQWEDKGRFIINCALACIKAMHVEIFSHGDAGLEGKDKQFHGPKEYLNLRLPVFKDYRQQIPTMPTLQVESLTGRPLTPNRDTMIVHLGSIGHHDYDHQNMYSVGQLGGESTNKNHEKHRVMRRVDGTEVYDHQHAFVVVWTTERQARCMEIIGGSHANTLALDKTTVHGRLENCSKDMMR